MIHSYGYTSARTYHAEQTSNDDVVDTISAITQNAEARWSRPKLRGYLREQGPRLHPNEEMKPFALRLLRYFH